MSKKKGKITRSFYYYDIILMNRDSENFIKISNQVETFYKIFQYIQNTQEKIKNGKEEPSQLEVSIDNGDKIYIIVDKNENSLPIEFRLILCRSDALPLVENKGLLNFLTDYLPKDFTLAEITHCIIFPEYGIMGAEYNFSGAKATAIKAYLPRIYPEIDYVYCANKLDNDVIKKLRKNESFSLFSLSVKSNSKAMTELMNNTSIFHLPFTNIADIDIFEICLKRRKSKTHQGFDSPISIDQMDKFIREYREDIKSFKVSQGSIQGDKIDLLHDKLVKKSEITQTINKTIKSKDAYNIIKEFFYSTVLTSIQIKT